MYHSKMERYLYCYFTLFKNNVLVINSLYIGIISNPQKIIVPKLYAGNHIAKHNAIPIIITGIKANIVVNIDLLNTFLYSEIFCSVLLSLLIMYNKAA